MSATDINDWPGHPDADPDCECCLGDGLQADGETPCPCIDARKANIAAQTIPSAPQPEGEPVTLTYTNWRGETAQRTITPKRIWWGATDWHPEPQWLLTAFDAEKQADRDFALKDFGAATPQPAGEAVLREIIDWCHLQPGNYPNWMDRARQAVGDFEGDPGQPPQPSASVVEALRELVAACEAYPVNIPRADAALDNAHAALRALKGDK